MRTYFEGLEQPKKLARRLSDYFPAIKLMQAQLWVAKISGYRDWHDLHEQTLSPQEPPSVLRVPMVLREPRDLATFLEATLRRPVDKQERETKLLYASQVAVLESLLAPYEASKHAEECWDFALGDEPGSFPRGVHYGKGSPLYNELQKPWFVRESDLTVKGSYDTEEGLTVEGVGSFDGCSYRIGFQNHQELERYVGKTTNTPPEILSMMRRSLSGNLFSQRFPLDGGGSDIRQGVDNAGHPAIQQHTQYRFWMRNPKGRMLALQGVCIIVGALRESSTQDSVSIVLTDAWGVNERWGPTSLYLLRHQIFSHVATYLAYFARCRVGHEEGRGLIRIAASTLAGISLDFLEDMQKFSQENVKVQGFDLSSDRFDFVTEVLERLPLFLKD